MAVVMEVQELIAPLCDYAQSVFKESHDDEKSAHRRKVAM